MFLVSISSFLLTLLCGYLAETLGVVWLAPAGRGVLAAIAIGVGVATHMRSRAVSRLFAPERRQREVVLPALLMASAALALTFAPVDRLYGDEYFRMSYARAIDAFGLPLRATWYVAGSSASIKWYAFAEYVTAAMHGLTRVRIELVYAYGLAVVVKLAMALVAAELVRDLGAARRRWLFVTMAAAFVSFGWTPFWQALFHHSLRQTAFGELLVVLSVSAILHAERARAIGARTTGFIALLPAAMTMLGAAAKIAMVPVLGLLAVLHAAVQCYGLDARERARQTMIHALAVGAACAVYWICRPATFTGGGHWLLDPLHLWRSDGAEWYFRQSSVGWISLPIALGLLPLAACLVLQPQSPASWAIAVAVAGGFVGGNVLRFSRYDGGAEVYPVFAALVAAGLLCVVSLARGGKRACIPMVLCLASLAAALSYDATQAFPRDNLAHPELYRACRSLPSRRAGHRLVVAHTFSGNTWSVNGLCDHPTLAFEKSGGLPEILGSLPENEMGLALSRDLRDPSRRAAALARIGELNLADEIALFSPPDPTLAMAPTSYVSARLVVYRLAVPRPAN